MAKGGIIEVGIEFYNKTDMFFHHSGSFLSASSRSRVEVNMGQFIKIAFTWHDFQTFQDSFQKNFEFSLISGQLTVRFETLKPS